MEILFLLHILVVLILAVIFNPRNSENT